MALLLLLLLLPLAECAVQTTASPMRFARFAPASAPPPRAYGAIVTNDTSVIFAGGRVGSTPDAAPDDMSVAPSTLNPRSAGGVSSLAGLSQQAVAHVPENLRASLGGVAAYAFGGIDLAGVESQLLWSFGAAGWVAASATGAAPSARRGASLTFVPSCGGNATSDFSCMLLVGGVSAAVAAPLAADNVWMLLLGPLRWVNQATLPGATGPAPPGLFGHCAIPSADGKNVIIYGGSTQAAGASSDTYQLSPTGFYDAAVQEAEMSNIALLMPTNGSSAAPSVYAPLGNQTGTLALNTQVVVDGSITTTYGTGAAAGVGSCFVSFVDLAAGVPVLGTTSPWWRVDLGSARTIWQLRFWMRADVLSSVSNQPGPAANTGVSFWVSNTTGPLLPWEGNGVQIPNLIPNPIYAPNIIKLLSPVSGRYVWAAQLGAQRVLQLCQLQILQPTPWTWRKLSGVVNIALNKFALQPGVSNFFAYGDPLNAIDGIAGTGARTPNNVANVWLMVDLGRTFWIKYISVLDGAGTNWFRNNATEVALGDNADPFAGPNQQCFGPAPITCNSVSSIVAGNSAAYGADGW